MCEMKGITCCGDCISYDWKKHRCKLGARVENDPQNPFFDDCPLPSVEPKGQHQRWIPVSEPPKISGEYNVMLRDMGMPTSLWFSRIRKGWYEYGDDDYDYRHEDVTHWMQMPEPPKEGE